ncbi:MAG TPA: sodium:proton exchanger [Elusimicrobia bacterium]|nr:sodium:proton exchanger [Elusimicrobiota bacterium]
MSLKARHLFYYAAALLACAQWPLLHKTGFVPGPPWEALFPGLAVLGAAFLLSWAAEAAEMDIPQGVSVTLLALIAVLPEYAVDMYFAWKAGKDPAYTAYACANMTGANRLLIGLGWAAVLFVYAAAHKKKQIELDPAVSPELVTLGLATLYAFLIPLKSTLSLLDFVVFLALFGVYAYRVSIAEVHEPELEGPAATIGALPKTGRRAAVTLLFLYAAAAIWLAAEPFAEGMLATGRALQIDEFFLVQWLAPLASEAPEFIVATLFALRGKGAVGLRILLASKVNQWTLLVGMLPLAYSLSAGSPAPMHLDARQAHEILLTAAQSIFALAILINLRFNLWEGGLLVLLFSTQLFFTSWHTRVVYVVLYLVGTAGWLANPGTRVAVGRAFRVALDFRKR